MHVEQTDPEWALMWEGLKTKDGETARECQETGEVWQYMGTQREVVGVMHCFRHRSHPVHQARVIESIRASDEFAARPDVVALPPWRDPTVEDLPF